MAKEPGAGRGKGEEQERNLRRGWPGLHNKMEMCEGTVNGDAEKIWV